MKVYPGKDWQNTLAGEEMGLTHLILCTVSLYKKKWQARRDSNPHHPVLETGALAVGATGL
jgi:hypothetical protein